jgi:hypothetical protein
MNKKILMLLVTVLAVTILAVPVMAKPTNGQKTAVRVIMQRTDTAFPDVVNPTGNVVHLYFARQTYDITIKFDENPDNDLVGTGEFERKMLVVKQPHKKGNDPDALPRPRDTKWIMIDYYEFDFGDGGFVGNAKVLIDGGTRLTLAPFAMGMGKGLFHGTGDFEGQTLNVGHHWGEPTGTITWTGYWLKCSVYPPTP